MMIIVTAMMMKSSKANLKKNKRLKNMQNAFDKKEAGKIPGLFICSHDWLF